MKPEWRNDSPEFNRRLTEWAKTSGVEAKEWQVPKATARGKICRSLTA